MCSAEISILISVVSCLKGVNMYKLMIAEDEEFILEGLKSIIDWKNCELNIVHTAHDGEEAIHMWKEEQTDIVITDITMPKKNGLELLEEIRKIDSRVRFIILTGYDEFEYARTAIALDVDDYILKPINECELEKAVKKTCEKLKEIDFNQKEHMDYRFDFFNFLSGNATPEESEEQIAKLEFYTESTLFIMAGIKVKYENLSIRVSDIYMYLKDIYESKKLKFFYSGTEEIFAVKSLEKDTNKNTEFEFFKDMQNRVESDLEIQTFFTVSKITDGYDNLPDVYRQLKKLQKYLLIEGYGSCISKDYIENRKSEDISIDGDMFRKMILSKDRNKVKDYLEDLFLNNIQKKDSSLDTIYQLSIKIAMILQTIMDEFKLSNLKSTKNLADIMDEVYSVEDLSVLKSMFIALSIQIMDILHTEESRGGGYTPVIRQILNEIKKDYRQDINLKTLAYKFNMNTSYLGQIFQKEVGCSFSSYVSSLKNSKARELILNTNMKINDIAREVGYTDTSYFYRKFKQCYGVSPATLREMKRYE